MQFSSPFPVMTAQFLKRRRFPAWGTPPTGWMIPPDLDEGDGFVSLCWSALLVHDVFAILSKHLGALFISEMPATKPFSVKSEI